MWVRERLGAERVSERRACQVLGQARSTQRRERHIPNDEARLVAEMVELATQYGRYGYRRITAMLRWEGWKVNHKRVERLWRQEGLKVPPDSLSEGDCGSMMDPAFGYERLTRITSGAMTSCMSEPMRDEPFGC